MMTLPRVFLVAALLVLAPGCVRSGPDAPSAPEADAARAPPSPHHETVARDDPYVGAGAGGQTAILQGYVLLDPVPANLTGFVLEVRPVAVAGPVNHLKVEARDGSRLLAATSTPTARGEYRIVVANATGADVLKMNVFAAAQEPSLAANAQLQTRATLFFDGPVDPAFTAFR